MSLRNWWSVLFGTACLVIVIFSSIVGFSQSPQPSVQLTTVPSMDHVIPFEAEATTLLGSGQFKPPVQLKFRALDAVGQPLSNAQFHLQVLTPEKTPWFTTDFPLVEGTKLLDIVGDAPTGEFQIEQVFPIRGTYKLLVQVTPTLENAFVPMEQTLTLSVPENLAKFRYLSVLVGVLLVMGFIGGWVIGARDEIQPGEIAPRRVRFLLSGVTVVAIVALLSINISAEMGQAHITQMSHVANDSGIVESEGLKLEIGGDYQATVGQPAALQVKLTDSQNQPVTGATFTIKTTQLENNWVAFAYQGVSDSQGQLMWQQEFFDGANHKIEVEVSPQHDATLQFQPFKASQEIEVIGVAPPLGVRLIGLFYLVGVLIIGLMMGLWFARRRIQRVSYS
ncbi:hypothetical protein [Gloeothece verrucosa]|uniref:Uncharacterized protein n=1 Tax=Gloeothece verrucosa (strain PCC 7822) TaxID=497965 RepID=E0UDX6_GLOV7|nr:hypothetical protein [Gloeothece verrucosa]ADN12980.1 conserved hypothetical protein [Gloeothece verrucosa PCC 7822]